MAWTYQRGQRREHREEFARNISIISFAYRVNTYLLSSGSLGNSQRHTKDGVGTKLSLVWSSIKLDQEIIDFRLIFDINVLLDECWANDLVDVGNGLGDTFASPLALVSITKLNSLVLSCIAAQISCVSKDLERIYEPVEAPDGTMAR
jgi:hypothetical protein